MPSDCLYSSFLWARWSARINLKLPLRDHLDLVGILFLSAEIVHRPPMVVHRGPCV